MTEYHSLIHCTWKWRHLIERQWLIHSGIHQYDLKYLVIVDQVFLS